jgi:hypothetical protein
MQYENEKRPITNTKSKKDACAVIGSAIVRTEIHLRSTLFAIGIVVFLFGTLNNAISRLLCDLHTSHTVNVSSWVHCETSSSVL